MPSVTSKAQKLRQKPLKINWREQKTFLANLELPLLSVDQQRQISWKQKPNTWEYPVQHKTWCQTKMLPESSRIGSSAEDRTVSLIVPITTASSFNCMPTSSSNDVFREKTCKFLLVWGHSVCFWTNSRRFVKCCSIDFAKKDRRVALDLGTPG